MEKFIVFTSENKELLGKEVFGIVLGMEKGTIKIANRDYDYYAIRYRPKWIKCTIGGFKTQIMIKSEE